MSDPYVQHITNLSASHQNLPHLLLVYSASQHVRTLCAAHHNPICHMTEPARNLPHLLLMHSASQHVRTLCAAHHKPVCHMTEPASPPARVLCEPA